MLKLLSELGARWTTFISAARAACTAASSENPAALAAADVAALAAASLGLPVDPPLLCSFTSASEHHGGRRPGRDA